MKNIKKTTAAINSSNLSRTLRIVTDDQSNRFASNLYCVALLAECLPLWVPANIFFRMTDALRGYSKGMATLMTENLIYFISGAGRKLTGITHVDNQLLSLYAQIHDYAIKHGKELGPLF